ncbi:sigma-70 family RNA polymerase sigma factor [uncultured Abyssibacter sp.]|uniref:RNA polymerase sigma factor n=1 Tax=uncultured Abyssibacter sp. TaxID=2320202 RepID=UPI0032B168C3
MSSRFDIPISELTLAALRRGDMRAQESIYRTFEQPVFELANRMSGCSHLAADITQDTFMRAFAKVKSFRGESPFWGWLRQIAVRETLQVLRKRKRWTALIPEAHESAAAAPDSDDTLLEQALTLLPDTARAVVWLYHVEGYTHPEIADLMGKTPSFSKSQLSRAHAKLRGILHPDAVAPASGATSRQSENQPCLKPLSAS